jgi:hypothetical protein
MNHKEKLKREAWEEYSNSIKPAWDKYDEVRKSAWDKYKKEIKEIDKSHDS